MVSHNTLARLQHWLHPHHETNLQPQPETPPVAPPSQGCMGYQVGSGAILHQQQALVHQVNEQLNLPDELQPFFDQTLDKLTQWLHLLPAHPLHHCEPTGAIRHALETSFWTVTATEQIHVDHNLYPDQRRTRQPVWRLMAGVAGLLYDSGRMVSCVSVESESSGQWPALRQGLGNWLQRYRIDGYSPHWQHCEARPENATSPEYTWTNLLLLDQLTPTELRYLLQPNQDKGALWQTFISALVGQCSAYAVKQLVSAVEIARLKSVKLHYDGGEALSSLAQVSPAQSEQDNGDHRLEELSQVVSCLNPANMKWAKDSLLLCWPDDLGKIEGLPEPEVLLQQWHQQGWLRPVANQLIFKRNGRQVIALQPEISRQCRQWLSNTAITKEVELE